MSDPANSMPPLRERQPLPTNQHSSTCTLLGKTQVEMIKTPRYKRALHMKAIRYFKPSRTSAPYGQKKPARARARMLDLHTITHAQALHGDQAPIKNANVYWKRLWQKNKEPMQLTHPHSLPLQEMSPCSTTNHRPPMKTFEGRQPLSSICGVLRENKRHMKNQIIMELLFIKYFDTKKCIDRKHCAGESDGSTQPMP